jgi:hypothetical protein
MSLFVVTLIIEPGRSLGQQFHNMFMEGDSIIPLSIIAVATVLALSLRYALAQKAKTWSSIAHTAAAIGPVVAILLIAIIANPPSPSEAGQVFIGIATCMAAFGALVHFVPRALRGR